MPRVSPGSLPRASFDLEAFRSDVQAYCSRQGWNRHRLACEAGPHYNSVKVFFDKLSAGLVAVSAMAKVCDLSLDRYVIEGKGRAMAFPSRGRANGATTRSWGGWASATPRSALAKSDRRGSTMPSHPAAMHRPVHGGYPDVKRPAWHAHTSRLLGKEVEVVLQRSEAGQSQVVARGRLLSFEDSGQVVIQDDMGFAHFCWPALDIRLLSWSDDDARRNFARQMAQVDEAERKAWEAIDRGDVTLR